MVTLKSSSDSEWPLGVISGFSISNFNLGCKLSIVDVSLRRTDQTKQLDKAWISVFNFEQSEATKKA